MPFSFGYLRSSPLIYKKSRLFTYLASFLPRCGAQSHWRKLPTPPTMRLHGDQLMKITKTVVEHAAAPNSGQKFIRDNELRGFALRITERGAKSFVWEGRIKGRMRRFTIGAFPALSVLAARQRALSVKAAVAGGNDPSEERKNDRRELTFATLAAQYA